MTIGIGDRLPTVNLKRLTANGVQDVALGEVTNGKVVLFAVPGAFTPTCSERHLPGFLEHAEAIKAKGVDRIVCVSVNDPFVMSAWSKHLGVGDRIEMLSDGNGELTKAIGLDFDASAAGLGIRSKRYAMVVDDGVVKALMVEEVPSKAERSAASAVLDALSSKAAG